jgi:hypothetical protein
MEPPFLLVKGSSIYAEVIGTNYYGDSVFSVSGNGAVILLVPDAPVNLMNDPTITTD